MRDSKIIIQLLTEIRDTLKAREEKQAGLEAAVNGALAKAQNIVDAIGRPFDPRDIPPYNPKENC